MPYSLFDLAARLERRANDRRSLRRLAQVQRDPHLARDIGMPYLPPMHPRVDKW